MTDYTPSGVAQSPSGEAQLYLPHVTRRVPRSVHAKFYADWTKTVGARGIHTSRQTDRHTDTQTHRQIKLGGATVSQTVTINKRYKKKTTWIV